MEGNNTTGNDCFEFKKEIVYKAIEDAGNTIRFLDTKVGGVFVVIGLIITFLGAVKDCVYDVFLHFRGTPFHFWLIIVALTAFSVTTIISVVFGFRAIRPKDNPIEHVDVEEDTKKELKSLWYLGVDKKTKMVVPSLEQYVKKIDLLSQSDLLREISVELMKLSYIRNMKYIKSDKCIAYFKFSLLPLAILLFYMLTFYCFTGK